jgi:hypothetical protein
MTNLLNFSDNLLGRPVRFPLFSYFDRPKAGLLRRCSMRCDEVSKELSAPSRHLDPSAVSAHLEECPDCANWANRVKLLDELWDATRPSDPPASAFDAIWAGVSAQVEATEPVATIPMPQKSRAWRKLAVGLVSAAAASLVLALWMGRQPQPGPNPQPPPLVAEAQTTEPDQNSQVPLELALCDLEQGPTPIIHLSNDTVTVESQPLSDVSDTVTVAAEIDILNYFETLGL